ncbi:heavy-metal-associated domain-containing protein [Flavobacterium silvaticum]|uniref:Heavy-metal-associated domain-containing protein n=1 Tax=Flavobacterium silvaticum TaxID=1852020 RepID=A0A972JIM6_9FLAO|nr:heavy metal-associated domain-containing protein [Flavobacterium silvaticum]NMH29205.1 heavy-metal-associated domain-containing protein [Flavobacterium silvaticum]
MTHTYKISGMTCEGCLYKVEHLLSQIQGVTNVKVSLEDNTATVDMNRHVPETEITESLGGPNSKYKLQDPAQTNTNATDFEQLMQRSWFETYKPILLIFGYILVVTLLIQFRNDAFNAMQAMRHFMAGFFLVFSFFKLLNLKGFAESYAMYDVIARKFPVWGYLYAFVELGLGIAYLVDFNPVVTNTINLLVMSVSIIGVLQTVLNKKKIQCACLGDIFKLPMSTVTIVEDGLMILMAIAMLAL